MDIVKTFRNSTLVALVAAGALISLGFSSPASAASDYLLQIDVIKGEVEDKSIVIDGKLDELETLLGSLEQQREQALSLMSEVEVLGGELQALEEQISAASEGSLAELSAAQALFTEQIAPILDPETVQAVTLNFSKIEFEYKPQRGADGSESSKFRYHDWQWTRSFEPLSESLTALQSLITEVSAGVGGSKKSRSNISNN